MSQPPPAHEEGDTKEATIKSEATMPTPGSGGVSKRDLEIMKGIVDHLTEAKDEKLEHPQSIPELYNLLLTTRKRS